AFSTRASVSGFLATDGQTLTVDVNLPGTSSVFGTVYSDDGITPVINPALSIVSLDSFGFEQNVSGNSSGNYQTNNVQAGTLQIAAANPSRRDEAGIVTVQLSAGQPLNVNITLGNAFAFGFPFFQPFNLDGTDGFRYDVQCNGDLGDGGAVD